MKSMCAVLKIEEERRCPWWRDENEGKIKLQKKVCPSLKPNSPRELFDFLSVATRRYYVVTLNALQPERSACRPLRCAASLAHVACGEKTPS